MSSFNNFLLAQANKRFAHIERIHTLLHEEIEKNKSISGRLKMLRLYEMNLQNRTERQYKKRNKAHLKFKKNISQQGTHVKWYYKEKFGTVERVVSTYPYLTLCVKSDGEEVEVEASLLKIDKSKKSSKKSSKKTKVSRGGERKRRIYKKKIRAPLPVPAPPPVTNAFVPGSSVPTEPVSTPVGIQFYNPNIYQKDDSIEELHNKFVLQYGNEKKDRVAFLSRFLQVFFSVNHRKLQFEQSRLPRKTAIHPHYSCLLIKSGFVPADFLKHFSWLNTRSDEPIGSDITNYIDFVEKGEIQALARYFS